MPQTCQPCQTGHGSTLRGVRRRTVGALAGCCAPADARPRGLTPLVVRVGASLSPCLPASLPPCLPVSLCTVCVCARAWVHVRACACARVCVCVCAPLGIPCLADPRAGAHDAACGGRAHPGAIFFCTMTPCLQPGERGQHCPRACSHDRVPRVCPLRATPPKPMRVEWEASRSGGLGTSRCCGGPLAVDVARWRSVSPVSFTSPHSYPSCEPR